MIDLATAEHIADKLAQRKDCQTAAQLVRQLATTERLRDEQFPPQDHAVVCFALIMAIFMIAGAALQ